MINMNSKPDLLSLLWILCFVLIAGCSTESKAAMTDRAVPTFIASPSYEFCGYTNAPATGMLFGFTSLKDAKLLRAEIEIVHAEHQLRYFAAKELNNKAIEGGQKLQEMLFDKDTGYVSLGLAALAGMGSGGLLSFGAYRRGVKTIGPDQITREEHESKTRMAGMMAPDDFKQSL